MPAPASNKSHNRRNKAVSIFGHNSDAGKQLKSLIERIEKLEEEKKAIGEDIRDVYIEAKSAGFDTKVMRHVAKLRKQDAVERREFMALVDVYMHALGMTPQEAVEASGALD